MSNTRSGTTYGLFFAFGSLGSLLMAPFFGRRFEPDEDANRHLSGVPLLLALGMTVLAIGFVTVATPSWITTNPRFLRSRR